MYPVSELRGIEFLEEYRKNKDKYLPLYPAVWERDSGMGWDCGLFTENCPFFSDFWYDEGFTMLDYFIPYDGVKGKSYEELFNELLEIEDIVLSDDYPYDIMVKGGKQDHIREKGGVKFIKFQIMVAMDDDRYIKQRPRLKDYSLLTEYRESIKETEE